MLDNPDLFAILKGMRPFPLADNNAKKKKPVMIRIPCGLKLSGPAKKIISCVRAMPLTLVLVLITLFAVVCSGTAFVAWAGPENPVPAGLPAGAPEGRPEPSIPAPPMEGNGTAAPLPNKAEQLTVPSLSGEPLTVPTATVPPALPQPPAPAHVDEGFVDVLHSGISRGFLTSATWLDSFFGDERYEAEINRSQLKVRFDAFREGSGGMDYLRPNFNLRLVLPQLRHKTRLVISGDPNVDVDATATHPGGPGTNLAKPPERNLTTALQYVPLETKFSNFSIRAGVKLHQGKLSMLAGPRYRYLIPLDPWDLRFTQEFIWSSDMRWQSRTRFDLERPLPNGLFFRTSLEGVWSENVVGYPYALSILLRQPLDGNRALQYEWVNSFQTRPTDLLIEELFVFRYRQRFWRDWLFLEIAPQVRYPRSSGFAYTPGILFRLEMVFGDIQKIF